MPDMIIRNIDESTANALTAQAAAKGISREMLLKQILDQYVKQIGAPRKGYKGYASSGAEITLRNNLDSATATGKNMTSQQAETLKRASLMCQPKNGGHWTDARKLLEDVGFEIYEL